MFDFSEALKRLKKWQSVTRSWWFDAWISVHIQLPDDNSKMTKPYLYMEKRGDIFPLDLSCESIFAEDWIDVDKTDNIN